MRSEGPFQAYNTSGRTRVSTAALGSPWRVPPVQRHREGREMPLCLPGLQDLCGNNACSIGPVELLFELSAALDHDHRITENVDVLKRITTDGNHISVLSGLDRPVLTLNADYLRR